MCFMRPLALRLVLVALLPSALATAWGCEGSEVDTPGGGRDGDAAVADATTGDASLTVDGSLADAASSATGTLVLEVQVPDGGVVGVTVKGVTVEKVFSASTTLTGLAPGVYEISSTAARLPATVVSTLYMPTAPPTSVTVSANAETKVTLSYARRPGTGLVWGGGTYPGVIFGFSDAQLAAGDAGSPAVAIDAGFNLNGPESIAIDERGNLWTPDNGHNRILRYDRDLLDTSGSPPPSGAILGVPFDAGGLVRQTLGNPEGLAFDAKGNLWVTNCGVESSVIRYDANELDGGALTPSAMLRDTLVDGGDAGVHHTVDCVYDLAFDAQGGLWYMNTGRGGAGFLERSIAYVAAPGALSGLTHAEPDLLVLLPGQAPAGVAFDASGKLWVTWGGELHRLAVDASARGVVQANVEATLAGGNLSFGGVTFDNGGAVLTGDFLEMGRFANPSAIVGDAAAAPLAILPVPRMDAPKLTLNPAPVGLPLHVFPK